MSSLGEKAEDTSCVESEVGKCSDRFPQYVSESLIGMSVKKVDHLRARLDNLKKMGNSGKRNLNVKFSSCSGRDTQRPITQHLRKQLELRGKLYEILQKHADQSCEDFIHLLKLTASSAGKETNELKPSNIRGIEETFQNVPRGYTNVNDILNSAFSQYLDPGPFKLCEKCNENSDTDDMY